MITDLPSLTAALVEVQQAATEGRQAGDRSQALLLAQVHSKRAEELAAAGGDNDSNALFRDQATLLAAIVTVSMVMTPFLMMVMRALPDAAVTDKGEDLEGPRSGESHVVIVGFGRMGQIISQVIAAAGIDVVAIDNDPAHIRNAERFGFKVYFGDARRRCARRLRRRHSRGRHPYDQ